MADVKDRLNEVPSWDGSSKTWRRYCKEVGWYLSGTKSSQRKYVAAKLISRLSGAARLLSMSWHQRDFEGEEGVQVMLRRFASSPLVRRSLPNAAATMSSYFMFQRRPGESIAQFLARETLGFEEFQEALLQLKEEKDGISPADRLFELPEITTSETSDKGERYYNPWHRDQRWRDWEETPFEEQVEQTVDDHEGYAAVPQTSDAGEEAAPHSPAGSPNRTRQTQRSPSRKTEQQRMIDGLGPMDSFILDVLRGWRLLVAASLTNDEWRDILASTGNKLDYPAIAEALQTLWDEQLNHHHGASKGTVLQQHWVETADPWYNAAWHESSWDTEDWHESDWHSMDQFGAWPQAANDPVDNTATTDDDPELQEALEAEKAAEALAVEARRTWSQAQQATTALRRDRGFGQFAGTSSSKGGKGNIRCHICSGPHFARDCPDRQHPQYRKGGGKQLSPAELDAYFFKGKGKGMRKGKDQMMSSWDDSYMAPWDVMYTQKGKNKNAGKGGKLRSTVNVYGMDYGGMDFSMMELHTLEFHETMEAVPLELYTSNETPAPRAIPEGFGMLDCGATASAGPEASVKKLIAKLRESDPQLKVTIDVERRPFFRYGSGRWGQAMYFASISDPTNPTKSFEVFALPNPTEYYQKSFKDYMLVPILVGMDFLTKVGLILDFQDGHAVFGMDPSAEPFIMSKNTKGHFMVDIGQYLFGQPSIGSQAPETFTAGMQLQVGGPSGDWFELAVNESDSCHVSAVDVHVTKQSTSMSTGFELLFQRRKLLNEQSHSAALGCPVGSTSLTAPLTSDGQILQGVQDRDPTGSRTSSGSRLEGSSSSAIMLAVSRQARALSDWKQRSWFMGQVRRVCSPRGVHSSSGVSGQLRGSQGPHLCGQGSEHDPGGHSEGHSSGLRDGGEDLRLCGSNGQDSRHEGQDLHHGSRSPGNVEQPRDHVQRLQEEDHEGHGGREDPGSFDAGGVDPRQQSGIATTSRTELDIGDDSLQPQLGRGSGGDHTGEGQESSDPPGLDETLGTTVPELQIEQFAKKVQFSDAPPEVHQFVDTTAETASEVPDQEYTCETVEFELLKIDEGKSNKSSRRGKSRRAAKHVLNSTSSRTTSLHGSASFSPAQEMEEQLSSAPSRSSGLSVLPWRICQAVMALSSMLLLVAQNDLSTLLRGHQQVDVWEIFCAPDSWLSSACHSEGLTASRINLHQNFDMYRADTYDELWDKFKRERPRRIWVSSRCTYWCPFTSLNYQTVEEKKILEKYRRKERAMFRRLIPFLSSAVQYNPNLEIFWEWPTRCYGWNEPMIQRLGHEMIKANKEWLFARIDGCRYGLLSKQGLPLRKQWTIATTSRHFFTVYRAKTCTGSHDHDHIQGVETNRSAYYPWKMCKSIAQHWRAELYPARWLDRLQSPVAAHMTGEEQIHSLQLEAMPQELEDDDEPNAELRKQWDIQLLKYHKAAGHPNNYNLARIIREAGQPRWKVEAALKLPCDDCKALKMGGASSGKIPPASMRPLPKAWEMVQAFGSDGLCHSFQSWQDPTLHGSLQAGE